MAEEHDEHIIEAAGRCRIVIQNGRVVEVGGALILSCPLAKRFACPVNEISPEAVKANIEYRIASFGMCTPDREVLGSREFVGFGASEILSFGLQAGMLDAAVIACDGAGTVVLTDPALVQGIGGRMSGLIKTVPYLPVIRRIEEHGGIVVDPAGASLDAVTGVQRAYDAGFARVAVTTALPAEAPKLRRRFPDVLVFAVHTTGLSPGEAETLVEDSDLVTSCASAPVREIAGKKALLQAGVSIPVFAITPRARDLVLEKLRRGGEQVLVKTARLPVAGDDLPGPLV
jgi:putative methanogenesis marker protein 8